MDQLSCVPCGKGATPATGEEIDAMLTGVPEWRILERDCIRRLHREFKFSNFAKALAFTRSVGGIAEAQQHHPEILTGWGRVAVTWWTHSIGGLHKNDFIMAARTDQLLERGLDS